MAGEPLQLNDFIDQFQSQLISTQNHHVGEWLREHLPYLIGPSITTFSPITDLPGAVITVRGCQFATACADNRVQVGGKDAVVIAASCTELKVISAHDISDGPVTVTVAGRTALGPVDFNVIELAGHGRQGDSAPGEVASIAASALGPALDQPVATWTLPASLRRPQSAADSALAYRSRHPTQLRRRQSRSVARSAA